MMNRLYANMGLRYINQSSDKHTAKTYLSSLFEHDQSKVKDNLRKVELLEKQLRIKLATASDVRVNQEDEALNPRLHKYNEKVDDIRSLIKDT
jgi:HKD family nuclease